MGIFGSLPRLRADASEAERRGYLRKVGRSKALDYLAWRSRAATREVLDPEDDCASSVTDWAQSLSGLSGPSPEAELAARGLDAALEAVASRAADHDEDDEATGLAALRLGYSRLSPQQAALLRCRLGVEPMRADLVRLGAGPRGAVSHAARHKLIVAAAEASAEDLITPEILLAVFGSRGR